MRPRALALEPEEPVSQLSFVEQLELAQTQAAGAGVVWKHFLLPVAPARPETMWRAVLPTDLEGNFCGGVEDDAHRRKQDRDDGGLQLDPRRHGNTMAVDGRQLSIHHVWANWCHGCVSIRLFAWLKTRGTGSPFRVVAYCDKTPAAAYSLTSALQKIRRKHNPHFKLCILE